MDKFIFFIRRISFPLLYVILMLVALNFYAKSTSYSQAKLLTVSNRVAGKAHKAVSRFEDYFTLYGDNNRLTQEIALLRDELDRYRAAYGDTVGTPDAEMVLGAEARYRFIPARLINNSTTRQKNFFTVDKGLRDGVEPDMAVVSADGVAVGYVLECSESMSVCMSVLNTAFRTSGKLKGQDYVGSVFWDGTNKRRVTMDEMSKYIVMEPGDTVVTTSHSTFFPEGMMIGTIDSYEFNNNLAYYTVRINLGTDMASLNHVLIVDYSKMREQQRLEGTVSR